MTKTDEGIGRRVAIAASLAVAALVGGCSSAQLASVQTEVGAIEVSVVNDANTFCKIAETVVPYIATGASIASVIYPPAGAVMVAISDTADPILKEACTLAGGITVAPVKAMPAS
jgi:hypothetical protein